MALEEWGTLNMLSMCALYSGCVAVETIYIVCNIRFFMVHQPDLSPSLTCHTEAQFRQL